MTIEPLYVVDTNALIWHLNDDRKLGKQAPRSSLRPSVEKPVWRFWLWS